MRAAPERARWSLLLLACLAIGGGTAWAADVTGKWTAEAKTSWGETYVLTLTLEQADGGLKGRLETPDGGAFVLENVKLEGDQLSFDVEVNYTKYHVEATVDGDRMEGRWEGGGDSGTVTATRS
ncbi:MAG: hypothetical protein Kow00109_06460 [Acidobacteriota bacterium]